MILTDTVIDTVKPTTKPFKLRDGEGMYLLIMPNGSKYFRLDYRLDGKRQTLALGVYPEISLEAARAIRDNAKKQIKDGIKPKLSTVKTLTDTVIDTAINTVSTQTDTVKSIYNERVEQQKKLDELNKQALSGAINLFTKDEQQKKQADTVRNLERKLQDERQKSTNLQANLGSLAMFTSLTKEQQDMLFTPDNPVLAKLKELSRLSVDAELVKELERRGFEVSIYKETPKKPR